jgi:hypothetical protein
VKSGDPLWREWLQFHRDSFVRWMRKIHDAVEEGDPNVLVTFNHAWFMGQPEKAPSFIENL